MRILLKMHTRSISRFLLRLHRNARIRKTDRKKLKRLLLFCRKYGLPFSTYTAEELQNAKGEFAPSAFVQQTVGVDNVCERAAVCAAQNGTLILHKFAQNGVTAAIAVPDWRVTFEEQEGEA